MTYSEPVIVVQAEIQKSLSLLSGFPEKLLQLIWILSRR